MNIVKIYYSLPKPKHIKAAMARAIGTGQTFIDRLCEGKKIPDAKKNDLYPLVYKELPPKEREFIIDDLTELKERHQDEYKKTAKTIRSLIKQ